MKFEYVTIIICLFGVSGCGWIQTLRKDIEDDEPKQVRLADYEFYRDPANRNVPPPPMNAADARAAVLNGTPVDFSGTRAKRIRTSANEFMAEATKNENSLWSEDGQTNYLFARNKLKAPGDLVTVQIEDGLRKDMVDSVRRLLPPEYRDEDIRVPGLTKNQTERTPAATPPAAGADPAAAAGADNMAAEDIMTAEVLERYPNGNVRVRGIKRVPFKHQVRNIEVAAIVKGADITENDMVKSSRFFDQHVEIYK